MNRITDELNKLKQDNQLRCIPDIESKSDGKIRINGTDYINYASNDYLGISTKENLRCEFFQNHNLSMSSASARLLTGSSPEYKALEKTVADIFEKECALIFNTGYQANLGVISALIQKCDAIFSDKLNHASIIDGAMLSKGDLYRYKHLDYEHLEQLLNKNRNKYKRALIVSESIFSMDGDIADIDKLIELKNKYDCLLMLDEAHAFCAVGKSLAGISGGKNIDIITATFGKAVGSFGAFCVSNKFIISYLINKSRSFIFSTSIPPLNVAWSNWLLTEKKDYIEDKKKILNNLTSEIHCILRSSGFETVSKTHIIPIIIGDNEQTVKISENLRSNGYYIPAIRPPTVPVGTSRLRISLTADCNINEFNNLLCLLQN